MKVCIILGLILCAFNAQTHANVLEIQPTQHHLVLKPVKETSVGKTGLEKIPLKETSEEETNEEENEEILSDIEETAEEENNEDETNEDDCVVDDCAVEENEEVLAVSIELGSLYDLTNLISLILEELSKQIDSTLEKDPKIQIEILDEAKSTLQELIDEVTYKLNILAAEDKIAMKCIEEQKPAIETLKNDSINNLTACNEIVAKGSKIVDNTLNCVQLVLDKAKLRGDKIINHAKECTMNDLKDH